MCWSPVHRETHTGNEPAPEVHCAWQCHVNADELVTLTATCGGAAIAERSESSCSKREGMNNPMKTMSKLREGTDVSSVDKEVLMNKIGAGVKGTPGQQTTVSTN